MTLAGLRKPQQSRSQETLERILRSSTALIAEQSYDEVTIAEIAARAKISVGGFYSRFDNKAALLGTLCQRLAEETQSKINAALTDDWTTTSLHELLLTTVSNNAELYEKYRGVLTVVHLQTRVLQPGAGDSARQTYNEKITAQLETLILKKRKQIVHSRPKVAIRAAIACMTSMLRDAIVFNDRSLYPKPQDLRTVSRFVAQIMYQYLAAESA